ncbi:MAG: ATP-binding cassette domain-containing protein, partial [Propionibacteriaceae bacterium]
AEPGSHAITSIASVELCGISYRYPNADADALSGLSLRLAPGRVVALSGPSGGGKSTALSCLLGFLTPTSGTILLDGKPLSDVDPRSWRKQLAYVAQTPGLIAGDVAANVRLGNPDATDAEIREALLRAGATDIDPSTNVGDDGEGLSAGERRRVGIARALLRLAAGASILLLDEPTAGLDHDTEAAVLESIRRSGAGALVVSHRDAVLAAADEVITV